jgi:predicted nucleic acid-binding protein
VILLDSDVAIAILRQVPAAIAWASALPPDELFAIPGYVALELIQGCLNAKEQRDTEKWISRARTVWIEPAECFNAFQTLRRVHLGNAIGAFDVLIAQTALFLSLPLHTFNQKHFNAVTGLVTIPPYVR